MDSATTIATKTGTVNRSDADAVRIARGRATWTAGAFGRIAEGYAESAREFINNLEIVPGERFLDVAAGTGNLAIPAALKGAIVAAQDIAPNLLVEARKNATGFGLSIDFSEGNCEELPYDDHSFDTVVSMFGAMFAPHPDRVVSELVRVCRPGGRIAMANWTPTGFIGGMLKAHVALVPPPPGVPSTLLWGDEETLRERFAPYRVTLTMQRRPLAFRFPFSPAGVVELFRNYYGPTVRTFEALDEDNRASLYRDLVSMWEANNKATNGSTLVEVDYLEVIAKLP